MKKIILHQCPYCNSPIKIVQDIILEKPIFNINMSNFNKILDKCIENNSITGDIKIKNQFMEFEAHNCTVLQFNQEIESHLSGTISLKDIKDFQKMSGKNIKKITSVKDIEEESILISERTWTASSLFRHISTMQERNKDEKHMFVFIGEDGSAEFYLINSNINKKIKFNIDDFIFAISYIANLYDKKIDLKFRSSGTDFIWISNIDDTTLIRIKGTPHDNK